MAFVSPRMSLKVWNSPSDPYDHEQLADNFLKLDIHDHSAGRGAQIGAAGIQNGAITNVHLAANSVTATNIQDGTITNAKLVGSIDPSGGYNTWKFQRVVGGPVAAASVGAQYLLGPSQTSSVNWTGTAVLIAGIAFYINPADVNIAGRTTNYRLRGSIITNTVAPAATYTFNLFQPATYGGASGAGPTLATLGAAVAGTTATVAAPAAGGPAAPATSSSFTLTAGWYIAGVTISTTNALQPVQAVAELQYRQV